MAPPGPEARALGLTITLRPHRDNRDAMNLCQGGKQSGLSWGDKLQQLTNLPFLTIQQQTGYSGSMRIPGLCSVSGQRIIYKDRSTVSGVMKR